MVIPYPDTESPRRVLFLGNYGIGNLGNDASLLAALRALELRMPDMAPRVVCPTPERLRSLGMLAEQDRVSRLSSRGLASRHVGERLVHTLRYSMQDALHAYRIMKAADALVVAGTGILEEHGGNQHVAEWPLSLIFWGVAAKLQGKPFIILSIGASSANSHLLRIASIAIAAMADYCSFRDAGSRRSIWRSSGRSSRFPVVPDLVFGWRWAPRDISVAQRHKLRPLVIIAAMSFGWIPRFNRIEREYRKRLVALVTLLAESGCDVQLLTAHPGDSKIGDLLLDRTLDASRSEHPEVERVEVQDLDSLLKITANADCVVASRYHTQIASLLNSRPTIALSYGNKGRELLASFGLNTSAHIGEFTEAWVLEQVKDAIRQQEEIARTVEERLVEFRAQLALQYDHVAALLVG